MSRRRAWTRCGRPEQAEYRSQLPDQLPRTSRCIRCFVSHLIGTSRSICVSVYGVPICTRGRSSRAPWSSMHISHRTDYYVEKEIPLAEVGGREVDLLRLRFSKALMRSVLCIGLWCRRFCSHVHFCAGSLLSTDRRLEPWPALCIWNVEAPSWWDSFSFVE